MTRLVHTRGWKFLINHKSSNEKILEDPLIYYLLSGFGLFVLFELVAMPDDELDRLIADYVREEALH